MKLFAFSSNLTFLVAATLFLSNAGFAQNPYDEIGKAHNVQIKYLLQNLKKYPLKGQQTTTIINILKGKYPSHYYDYASSVPEGDVHTYLKKEVSKTLSSTLNAQISSMESFLKTNPSVNAITTEVSAREKSIPKVSTEEKLYYLLFLTGIKHSAKLWLPTSKGGEDASSDILFARKKGGGISWWKVITADAVGIVHGAATAVASSGGAAAIPNPVTGLPPAVWYGLGEGVVTSGVMIISEW